MYTSWLFLFVCAFQLALKWLYYLTKGLGWFWYQENRSKVVSFTMDILLWYKQIFCSQKTVRGKNLLSLQIEWVYKEKRAYIIWQWPSTTVNQKSFPSTAEFWIILNVFVYLNMMLVKRFMNVFFNWSCDHFKIVCNYIVM